MTRYRQAVASFLSYLPILYLGPYLRKTVADPISLQTSSAIIIMQFFKLLALVSSLAVANAVQFTNTATELTGIAAGKPLTIKWSGASGAVTINLKSGPSTAQTFVEAITSKSCVPCLSAQ